MTQIAQDSFDRSGIELLLEEGKFVEALALLCQRTFEARPDRETNLYILFAKTQLYGPEPYEADIDALRGLSDLNDREKEMVRRIFLYAFQVAEKFGQEEKKWAYQRLLRKLLLGQPLNQPIPITPKAPPAPRRVTQLQSAAMILEPKGIGRETTTMADWTIWATFLTLGSAAAILVTYLLCRVRLEQTNNRVLALEKEIKLMRTREEANERKLMKIFDAVTALRGTTEQHLDKLLVRLDQLRADGHPVSS